MADFLLLRKLRELAKSRCTLLWLEGTKHERVISLKVSARGSLLIRLANETTRVVAFERYAVTEVGLQFWSQGRPGVLYRWEQVPSSSASDKVTNADVTEVNNPESPAIA